MSEHERHNQVPPPRKQYDRPSVEDTAEFETLALSCVKVDVPGQNCYPPNPAAS